MSEKTNKLNICLVKPEYAAFDDIIGAGAKTHPVEGVGTFYTEESYVKPPGWIKDFFGDALDGKFSILTASAKGVLLVPVEHGGQQRIFAVVFGHGRHLVSDGVIEERFGLKVVLNSVYRNSLRSIDKTTLGSTPKQSREQLSRESEAVSFGIDIEQDLVNAVTGRSKDARFGKTISGRDALALSVKVGLPEIREFLPVCLEQFESNDYKADFEWIDQIRDVRDPKTLATLNTWLVGRLAAGDLDKIWMAPPAVLDWVDVKGFRYAPAKKAELHPDLDAATFLAALAGKDIGTDLLRSKSVFAVSSKTDDAFDHWSAYRCFYAEAHIDDRMFVLNNGKWYEVAAGFTAQVLADFATVPESALVLPNYNHTDEGAYNESLPAAVANSHCMDREMIGYGGGHNTIEFCDLLTADRQLVHVKRYSGSAQLSHLFNQGVVSGELFVQEQDFRERLNQKLPAAHKLVDTAQRPDPATYEIVFAIISKSNNPLEIPFFSKVSLKNARRRLRGYGYTVTIKKIGNVAAA
jgi:uncharacterized protein (TIGR04141 family)